MKNNRVFFISQYFYPETFKGNDIAFDLAQKGVEVTVVTAIPNYPKGHFYNGYGLFKKRKEVISGVKVIRIPIIPRGNNAILLALNYLSFAINASIFTFFHLLYHKYDVCFVQQLSPITSAIPAIIFKKMTRKKVYTWVLDLWPESLQSAGGVKNKFILSFFLRIVKSVYRNSDKILMSSKEFETSIIDKGISQEKLVYYPNWADDIFGETKIKTIPILPNGFKVMFAGNLGEAQDFEHIVEAAKRLKEDDKIVFVILGDGRKKRWIDEQIIRYGLQNQIVMLGRYPVEYMPSFFLESDAMLVSLKNELIFNLTVPAKIQAYMSVGKPIIAMMNGAGHNLVNEAKCGLAISAESSEELVKAIRTMRDMSQLERDLLGANGKTYCDSHFDRKRCLDKLYNMLFNIR